MTSMQQRMARILLRGALIVAVWTPEYNPEKKFNVHLPEFYSVFLKGKNSIIGQQQKNLN